MRFLHRWTVGKEAAEPHLNEDALICAGLKGRYAVSDGASESFASRRWARILASRYVRQPTIDRGWIEQSIATYNSAFDRSVMSWSAQAAFDRGSFATLLGVQIDADSRGASIMGVGDSLAVLDDGEGIRDTFPYTTPEQFQANPLLLSTIHERNQAIDIADVTTHWHFGAISSPKLFCMTDAIGAWLLSDRRERMRCLRELHQPEDFFELVETARADGTMRRDDTSLLVIG